MRYRITVVTGDVRPEAARFFVWVSLIGSLGKTPEVRLNTRAHVECINREDVTFPQDAESDLVPLERKSAHAFMLNELMDIGSLDKVIMRLESETGSAADLDAVAWHLERVAVESVGDDSLEGGTEWAFSVNRWVNLDTDHLIELQRAMATEILLDDRGAKVVRVRLAMHHLPSEPAHEEIYVSGSIPELGSWNADRAVRMEKVQPAALAQKESSRRSVNRNSWHGDWEYCFTLDPEAASDFDYKYFIRNHRTNAMIWEHGPNRKMIIERIGSGGSDANVTLRLNDQWNTPTLCRKVLNSYLVNGLMSPLSKILGSTEDGVMAAVRRIRNELEDMRRENTALRSRLQAQSDGVSSTILSEEAHGDAEKGPASDNSVLPIAVEKVNLSQLSFHGIEQASSTGPEQKRLAIQLRQAREQTQVLHAMLEQLRAEARASSKTVAHLLDEQGAEVHQVIRRCQDARDHAMSMWRKEFQWRRKLFNQVQEITGNIRVFCRVRPALSHETDHITSQVLDSDKIIVRQKIFEFDRVFGPEQTQEQVYEDTSPLVTCAMDGYNVCIFAYGQTGSGKTYTMTGPPESRGVNHRALEELFRLCDERSAAFTYNIQVSMLEIYNEGLRDLVAGKSENRLEIKLAPDGNPYVPDLIWIPVESLEQVWSVIEAGTRNRAQGATRMNIHSSRSHLIVSIMIEAVNRDTGDKVNGKLHLVDLAGSERVSRSEAEGERLREAQHINKSLSALGDVFMALLAKQSHVPYRNSKLTFLLQDSLGGDSKTLMFVNVSPTAADETETLSSLVFAQRVAKVELPRASKHGESAELAKYMKAASKAQEEAQARDATILQLRRQVEQLQGELRGARAAFSMEQRLPRRAARASVTLRDQPLSADSAQTSQIQWRETSTETANGLAPDDKENRPSLLAEKHRSGRLLSSAEDNTELVQDAPTPAMANDEEPMQVEHSVASARQSTRSPTVSLGMPAGKVSSDHPSSTTALSVPARRSSSRQTSQSMRSPLAATNRDDGPGAASPVANPVVTKATQRSKMIRALTHTPSGTSEASPKQCASGAQTTTTVKPAPTENTTPSRESKQRPVILRETRADLLRRQANEAKRNGTPSRVQYAFGSRIVRSTTSSDSTSPKECR
jgi:hypothetical protein